MTIAEPLLKSNSQSGRSAGAVRQARIIIQNRWVVVVGAIVFTTLSCVALYYQQRFALPAHETPTDGKFDDVHNELINRLSGHTVYFIGDSVTRYQYIDLIYYWETGLVPSKTHPETLVDGKYDPSYQIPWKSWQHFFSGTTSFATAGKGFCDCWRTREWHPLEHIENRYYRIGDTRLSFNQFFKDTGVCSLRGRLAGSAEDGIHDPRPADQIKPDWCYTLPGFVQRVLDEQKETRKPLTIVLNSGLHERFSNATFQGIVEAFTKRSSVGHDDDDNSLPVPLLIWKTTTPSRHPQPGDVTDDHLSLPSASSHPNVRVLDTGKLLASHFKNWTKEDVYNDHLHFTGIVYHAFNQEVAAMIQEHHRSRPR